MGKNTCLNFLTDKLFKYNFFKAFCYTRTETNFRMGRCELVFVGK